MATSAPTFTQLTEQQVDELVHWLSLGKSKTWAAERIGTSRRTVHRWWQKPEFRSRVRKLAQTRLEDHDRAIAALAESAFDKLTALLESGSPSIQLQTARLILERADAVRETAMVARLEEVEEQLCSLSN